MAGQAETRGDRTLLGFDFGLRRIGVAVGQECTRTATALTTLQCPNQQPAWHRIEELIQEWQPDALVIGVPLHMDGQEQALTTYARQFGMQLAQRFGLPVHEVDERLSSYEAEEIMKQREPLGRKNKSRIDQLAASIILQDWFNQQAHE